MWYIPQFPKLLVYSWVANTFALELFPCKLHEEFCGHGFGLTNGRFTSDGRHCMGWWLRCFSSDVSPSHLRSTHCRPITDVHSLPTTFDSNESNDLIEDQKRCKQTSDSLTVQPSIEWTNEWWNALFSSTVDLSIASLRATKSGLQYVDVITHYLVV